MEYGSRTSQASKWRMTVDLEWVGQSGGSMERSNGGRIEEEKGRVAGGGRRGGYKKRIGILFSVCRIVW